jgi:hypothetical protein
VTGGVRSGGLLLLGTESDETEEPGGETEKSENSDGDTGANSTGSGLRDGWRSRGRKSGN